MADKSPPTGGDEDLPPPQRRDDRDSDRRRHSNRRRHSPPPFKRSRRADDRSGHGYDGGYERGMGGRSFADEKPRGQLMNRSAGGYQHGPSDSGFNRGGYADSTNRGNMQGEGLMSYKQFIQELEDDILPAEAECRYQEYRSEYISTQKRAFFDAHKDEEWLKNKYHPTNLLAVIEQRNEHAREVAKDFFLDLQSGTLDLNPSVTALSSSKLEQANKPNSDDETVASGKRKRNDRGRAEETDFSAAPKAHLACCEPARIEVDIKQAISIIHKLDNEKRIEDNVLDNVEYSKKEGDKSRSMGPIVIIRGSSSVKGLEGVELLDTLLTYLWRVHGADYYGMIETHEAKGLRHVRSDGKNRHHTRESKAEWEKKLDSFWKERLGGQDPLEEMAAKENIEAATSEVLDPYVRKIRDEKYGWKFGCGAKGCTKLFHASEYVTKHLKLKHVELVMELTSKVRDDLYFQNYMNDPDAPGGKPLMQQPQKDHLQRRSRLPLENRLRDDRGHRRNNEQGDNSEDRDEIANENSPTHKAGGAEGGSHDESAYDAYGGQHIGPVPPFGSDMPPILMPVPGAGPLGPFVPAPHAVAMQMLRDQGGPSAYDGGGRKMRPGPLSGRTPIIAVPPGLRQDPRQMRSYQDLDAPEDEVSVIDYRSL